MKTRKTLLTTADSLPRLDPLLDLGTAVANQPVPVALVEFGRRARRRSLTPVTAVILVL